MFCERERAAVSNWAGQGNTVAGQARLGPGQLTISGMASFVDSVATRNGAWHASPSPPPTAVEPTDQYTVTMLVFYPGQRVHSLEGP